MRIDNYKKSLLPVICLLLIGIAPAECAAQIASQAPTFSSGSFGSVDDAKYISRLSASHRFGEGVGFDQGYTTLEWLMPTYDNWDDQMLFFDGRAIISDDNARLGSNIGLGYRKYVPDMNRIFGAMGYWDTRYLDSYVFQQATFGVETLGQYVDARSFVYLPFKDGTTTPGQFVGNSLLIGRAAMSGVTAEIGLNSPTINSLQVSGFVGAYRFEDSDVSSDYTGWNARAEVRFQDQYQVDLTYQDDETLGQLTSVSVSLTQLLRMSGSNARKSMDHMFREGGHDGVNSRLGERVRRWENIVTQRAAAQAAPGTDYQFLHVVPGGTGDGTFENPLGSINDAAVAAMGMPNSVIYTRLGGTFTEDVTLGNDVKLLSNGPLQTLTASNLDAGTFTLPLSGNNLTLVGLPQIDGSLTLGSENMVNGFEITDGVSGTGITDTMLSNSRLISTTNALTLTDSTNITLDNLQLNAGLDGLEVNAIAGPSSFTATNITIVNASDVGIDLNATGETLTANIDGVVINSRNNGIDANAAPGPITLSLNNAEVASSLGTGISLQGPVTVNAFEGNTITMAAAGGIQANSATFATPQIAALTIGDAMAPANIQGVGLSLINTGGSLDIANLTIANETGTGLFLDTPAPTFVLTTGTTSSITTMTGPAIDARNATVALSFASLSSTGSPSNGILFNAVQGNVDSTVSTFAMPTSQSVFIQNTPAQLSINLNAATVDGVGFAAGDLNATGNSNGGFLDFESSTFSLINID